MKAIRLKKLALLAAVAGAMFVPLLHATPVQAATAYVKATGNDAAACLDELNACLTLDKAITVSTQSGKIIITGHGDFQGLTSPITGGLTIIAPDGGVSISQNTLSQPVFTINAASDTVVFKSIAITGGSAGTIGIQVDNGNKVYIENCTLKGFSNGAAQAMFLQPNPGAGVQSQLYISNTEVSNANTGLILIAPRSGQVKAYFTHVEVHNTNGYGIKADGTNGQGLDVAIADSAIFSMTGSAIHGITPPTASPGTPVVRMSIERTTILNSGGGAVVGNGGGSRMLVNKSSVMSHALGIYALNGGTVVLNDSLVSGNSVGVSLNGLGSTSPVQSFANNAIKYNGFAQCGDDVCNGASPGTLFTFSLR